MAKKAAKRIAKKKTAKKMTAKSKDTKKKVAKKTSATKTSSKKKTAKGVAKTTKKTTTKKSAQKKTAASKKTKTSKKAVGKKKTSAKAAPIKTSKKQTTKTTAAKVASQTTNKKLVTTTAKQAPAKAKKPSKPRKKSTTIAADVSASSNDTSETARFEPLPMPQVGDAAPDFDLPVTGGEAASWSRISLHEFRGRKNVVLYFYPKDDTPGCTKQACTFQADTPRYDDVDAVVIGVSKDDLNSHDKFRGKFSLGFMLAADEDATVASQYGAYGEKNNYGRTYMGILRTTFLIDKQGVIRAVWPKVSVEGHSEEVIAALNEINN